MRCLRHELLDREIVQPLLDAVQGGSPEQRLCNALLLDIRRRRGSNTVSVQTYHFRSQIRRKLHMSVQRLPAFRCGVAVTLHMQYIQLAVQGLRQACTPPQSGPGPPGLS